MSPHLDWAGRWIETVAPDEPQKLIRRLDWDGLTETGFADLLNRAMRDRDDLFAWQPALALCVSALQRSWDAALVPYAVDEQRPFLDIWWPIRALAVSQLSAALIPLSPRIAPGVLEKMADQLIARLCSLGERVLWDRFRNGRLPADIVRAHLGISGDGSGPPLRTGYLRFVQDHRRDGLSSLFADFPELGRLIGTAFALWLSGSAQLLRRVNEDRDALDRLFSIPATHSLSDIEQNLGDPHNGGQSVAILTFASSRADGMCQIVYKPKDLRVDIAYNALLHEFNATSDLPPLRNLTVYACRDYGYMEHVSHRPCADEEELRSHYRNAGRLTAILHVLGCTDCHHENLIACGDHLVLVDTETLFEPQMPDHVMEACAQTSMAKQTRLQERFLTSVLRVGLLPQWIFLGDAKFPVDVSALGIEPPLRETEPVQGWLGINSDGMMPGKLMRQANLVTSLPVGLGQRNPFAQHLDVFCDGFRKQCEFLVASRQSLLAEGKGLSLFAGLPRRIVLRATRVYSAILRQMLEPAALRSALERSLLLEQMARSYLMAETRPLNWPVLAEERRQLQQLDVPFFSHLIDGDVLDLNSSGDAIRGFFARSGLSAAKERLLDLSSQEIDFQIDLIRGVVQSKHMQVADRGMSDPDDPAWFAGQSLSSQLNGTEAAGRIARELCDLAIHDPQGYVEWLGPTLGEDGASFSYGPVGLSLYSGSIGLALLLHHLRDLPQDPAGSDAMQSALLRPLHELGEQHSDENQARWWRDQSLGLSGCGGVLLALERLGDRATVDRIVAAFRPRFVKADHQMDLLGGSAGMIGPMLRIGTEAALDHAIAAGEHLLGQQTKDGGWQSEGGGRAPLGFAHGTAGYTAALAALHHVTGQERFRTGAAAALALERAHFCSETGNWPTHAGTLADEQPVHFLEHWCNGAPGVGLGRACLWGTDLWDDICAQEIEFAVVKLIALEPRNRDHLCCGNLGLMSVLRILSSGPWPLAAWLKARAVEKITEQRSRALLRCNDKDVSLRCAGPGGQSLKVPGFFSGLSGMGLSLMEDRAAERTTAILMSGGLLRSESL